MSNPRHRIRGANRSLCACALALIGSAAVAFGQGPLVASSPFMPAGATAAGAAAAAGEAYQLAGASVQGSVVTVCIYERQAKRSEWIPVGGISDGIRVVSYDAVHDRAVVNIAGAVKQLTLRTAAVASVGPPAASGAAAPVAELAAPAIPIASPAAAGSARDQREARMLVSDLLEIGVQQRKAYQEAKQKAASETPAQPTN